MLRLAATDRARTRASAAYGGGGTVLSSDKGVAAMDSSDARNARMKSLHASGISCAEIGRRESLTRERVRQIVSGEIKPSAHPEPTARNSGPLHLPAWTRSPSNTALACRSSASLFSETPAPGWSACGG
jgi:hypothetical protein